MDDDMLDVDPVGAHMPLARFKTSTYDDDDGEEADDSDSLAAAGATKEAVMLRKSQELQHNLSLFQNMAFFGDSYDDLKTLVERIMETAVSLGEGDLRLVARAVPLWETCKEKVEKGVQLIDTIRALTLWF
ncbi:hypothetical protein HDU96_006249 [Phlyctochytrium bullatum]|nr:hypothetical protein HDU96_006249 [Phlyctochytrium bullatum]